MLAIAAAVPGAVAAVVFVDSSAVAVAVDVASAAAIVSVGNGNVGEDKERAAAAAATETALIRKIRAGAMRAAVYMDVFGPASLISLS